MNSKLKSDADLKKVAKSFFELARNAAITDTDPVKITELWSRGSVRMLNGITFDLNKQVLTAQHSLISRCTTLLGSKIGHEKEIEDFAWECVYQSLAGEQRSSDLSQIVSGFIERLHANTQRQSKYVAPNYAIKFDHPVTKLVVGPVEAMLTTELLSEIPDYSGTSRVLFWVGSKFDMSIVNSKINFQFPPIVWCVSIQAAQGHIEEEATWLINIAISLLRLSYPSEKYYGLFPRIGERELLPICIQPITKQGIALYEDRLIGGETSVGKLYEVDEDVLAVTTSQTFQDRAQAIFNASKNSLGERVGQGLGWLSRGRQTADRAEKFLFFFTAIEALLSSDDKTAPVVQTISRYVAVILQNDAKLRFQLANNVKSLYETRSSLVHSGKRNVSNSDVGAIQLIAECAYIVVMDSMDMKISRADFQASLSKASYGTQWLQIVSDPSSATQGVVDQS